MVRPRSCRHSRMAGGRIGGVRSLSPLTSATEAADSAPYRSNHLTTARVRSTVTALFTRGATVRLVGPAFLLFGLALICSGSELSPRRIDSRELDRLIREQLS